MELNEEYFHKQYLLYYLKATKCRHNFSLLYCHIQIWLGVRVTRTFRVGFFGLLKFRVLKTGTRNLLTKTRTRHFGYPKFRVRVRVNPNHPNCRPARPAPLGAGEACPTPRPRRPAQLLGPAQVRRPQLLARRPGADHLREGPEERGGGDGVGGGHWETEELGPSREDKMEGDEGAEGAGDGEAAAPAATAARARSGAAPARLLAGEGEEGAGGAGCLHGSGRRRGEGGPALDPAAGGRLEQHRRRK